ncbi:hypothetical protein LPUS_10440 [Lasallia pustulata]|uniref:Uncharacterized protein n=1 Tax=Lasallia pustulata TaxID=136370 RepID=A0A1W5D9K1_9LECA|nr:hypothetical protein LPUS_10440 [Lasallia pustulata]
MAPISPHLLALRSLVPAVHTVYPRSLLPATSPTSSTRSLHSISQTIPSIFRRQTVVVIPATYANLNSGPPPGTVVGIVLGSVGGFLLLLWLIYTCFNMGGVRGGGSVITEEEVVRRRSHSPRRRSRSVTEVSEVSRARSVAREPPPRREARRETIIVEETRRAPVAVEREDDIVEVIEDHSPPRRSRRGSQRQSGYRTVDPGVYGGGSAPVRKVSGRR